jgi:sugar phosphate isomerase/epimerase
MRFLFSTGSLWSYSIERCFLLAAQAGYDGIELVVDHRWESRQASYIKDLIEQHELPVLAIHSPFMPNVPGWPEDQPSRILNSVKLAEQLGSQVVVHHLPSRIGFALLQFPGRRVFIPTPTNPESGYRRWIEKKYPEVQSGTDVKLCIENMPAYRRFGRRWSFSHWNTVAELSRFAHLTIDTTHLGTWGLDPVEIYSQLSDRVAHIHLSNFDGREHQRPDNGHLALDRLLKRITADRYDGFVTLELYPEALHAGEPDEVVLSQLRSCLDFCHHWTGAV